jgi:hypothetical protein
MTSDMPLERMHSALAVLLPETATDKDPLLAFFWLAILPHTHHAGETSWAYTQVATEPNLFVLLLQAAAHHCSICWALYALLYNFLGLSQMSKALNHQLGQVDSSTTVESPRGNAFAEVSVPLLCDNLSNETAGKFLE